MRRNLIKTQHDANDDEGAPHRKLNKILVNSFYKNRSICENTTKDSNMKITLVFALISRD